jgi:proton glutamate symport protein
VFLRSATFGKLKVMDFSFWYRKLHWRIILGLLLGVLYGILAANMAWVDWTEDWIAPFGTIFVNLLKLIAVPLVLSSLICGVASLSDLRQLSRIGGKTIAIYVITTVIAVCVGLITVNLIEPGKQVPKEMRERLQQTYEQNVSGRQRDASITKERGPLQAFVDIVPENFFGAASSNRNMLQVVFFAILIGVGAIQLRKEKAAVFLGFFETLNEIIIRLVDLIMLIAPLGVFALIASTITSVTSDNPGGVLHLLSALGQYCLVVVLGLAIHMMITYGLIIRYMTPMKFPMFLKGIGPAQLVAFSTSSSAATLPLTMERVEERLGVSERISSFVLPLGAITNMDGTGLYQSVATVFIAQALGIQLDWTAQLTIVLMAVLASIGSASVPGAGMIMLILILEAIGIPSAGIALILGVDRILDMCRTLTNVTGDATVAVMIAASEGQLKTQD